MREYNSLDASQKDMGLRLAGVGIISVDYLTDEVTLDDISADLFGLIAGQPFKRPRFHDRIHPEDRPAIELEVDKLLDPQFEDAIEVVHRTVDRQGNTRWVHARKQLYRDPSSRHAQTAIAAVRDITAEVQFKERSEMLVRELAHRTKNLMSVATAIARQTMQHSGPDKFLDDFLPRLNNLSDNQEIVTANRHSDLRSSVETALARFRGAFEGRVKVSGDDVPLNPLASQAFSLITHELATNAIKYGALKVVSGMVDVAWQVKGAVLEFSWSESGGPPVIEPTRPGFGSRILYRYASITLSGTPSASYDSDGFSYKLAVPVAAIQSDAAA